MPPRFARCAAPNPPRELVAQYPEHDPDAAFGETHDPVCPKGERPVLSTRARRPTFAPSKNWGPWFLPTGRAMYCNAASALGPIRPLVATFRSAEYHHPQVVPAGPTGRRRWLHDRRARALARSGGDIPNRTGSIRAARWLACRLPSGPTVPRFCPRLCDIGSRATTWGSRLGDSAGRVTRPVRRRSVGAVYTSLGQGLARPNIPSPERSRWSARRMQPILPRSPNAGTGATVGRSYFRYWATQSAFSQTGTRSLAGVDNERERGMLFSPQDIHVAGLPGAWAWLPCLPVNRHGDASAVLPQDGTG